MGMTGEVIAEFADNRSRSRVGEFVGLGDAKTTTGDSPNGLGSAKPLQGES
jgi:hypothetical protein